MQRRSAVLRALVVFGGLMLAACAGTSFKQVEDQDTNGIRYYAAATYVLVKPDYENGKASVTLLTVPDTTRLFAVDSYSWFAKNSTTIDFDKGMIQKAVSDTDATKIATSSINALSELAKKAMDVAATAAQKAALVGGKPRKRRPAPPVFLFYVSGDRLIQVVPPVADLGPGGES